MKPTSSEQVVFAEALLRPTSAARAAYLHEACGCDTALRRAVEALLRASTEAGDFLEQPPIGLSADEDSTPPVNALCEKPGDRIGRYKLLQQIGEGGCGVVYMAEQLEPVRRRVALKVIKLGMDTRSVIARFEAERQALALMDHPNIAKVLDAGATEAGRPYFVMELVRGIKITDFCDENSLSTSDRLKLFTQVCQAIQHAHQKGIIHRDIKPSNILVTRDESVAVPKVIDFGIAKATTDQRLTDKTVFTAFEQFIGTPAYMSPEQAMMTSLDIDTRTDIYALGVLLYELLTGQTPFNANELMAAGLDAMRRTIREQEPARPSTRLSTMLEADLSALAKHHRAEPTKLGTLLRGDLDWIVMKALEKDRTRRYETASALAADVQRHLSNEPVTARAPSAGYRFQKLVQRNRLAFAAVSAVGIALVLGICVATWALLRERTARHEAEAARNVARAESARNEQVAKFLLSTVSPDMWKGQDATLVRSLLLDFFSQRLGTELRSNAGAEADLWLSVANSCAAIGDYGRAITNSQMAVSSYRSKYGENHQRVALALSRVSRFQRQNADIGAAQTNGEAAVLIARRTGDSETLAVCLLEAAKALGESDERAPEAIPLLRETMQLRRHEVPHLLALADSTRLLVRALQSLAAQGKPDEAKEVLNEELKDAPADRDLLELKTALNRPAGADQNLIRAREP